MGSFPLLLPSLHGITAEYLLETFFFFLREFLLHFVYDFDNERVEKEALTLQEAYSLLGTQSSSGKKH